MSPPSPRPPRPTSFPLLLILSLFLLALCHLPSPVATQGSAFVCREANRTAMPYCGSHVTWQITSDTREDEFDMMALMQHQGSCLYYSYTPYACTKFFPRCVNSTDGTAMRVGICTDVCQRGGKTEDCAAAFEPRFIEQECALALYSPRPNCISEGVIWDEGGSGYWWKVGLGVGLGCVGLLLIGLLYRHWRRDNATEAELDKLDEKKARKERDRRRKEKEKEGKERAKQSGTQGVSTKNPKERRSGAYTAPIPDEVEPPSSRAEGQPALSAMPGNAAAMRLSETELQSPARSTPRSTPRSGAKKGSKKRPKQHGSSSGAHAQSPAQPSRSGVSSATSDANASPRQAKHKVSRAEKQSMQRSSLAVQKPLQLSEEGAPSFSLHNEPLSGGAGGAHVLQGDEDAWKSGMPILVAPP